MGVGTELIENIHDRGGGGKVSFLPYRDETLTIITGTCQNTRLEHEFSVSDLILLHSVGTSLGSRVPRGLSPRHPPQDRPGDCTTHRNQFSKSEKPDFF